MVVEANSEESWLISEEQMEEVIAFIYLGVWLDLEVAHNMN